MPSNISQIIFYAPLIFCQLQIAHLKLTSIFSKKFLAIFWPFFIAKTTDLRAHAYINFFHKKLTENSQNFYTKFAKLLYKICKIYSFLKLSTELSTFSTPIFTQKIKSNDNLYWKSSLFLNYLFVVVWKNIFEKIMFLNLTFNIWGIFIILHHYIFVNYFISLLSTILFHFFWICP